MSTPSRRHRPSIARNAAVTLLGVAGALSLGGCAGLATDTPLGVTSAHRAVLPGATVTGDVIYPDGTITVTLAPQASPVDADGHRTVGAQPCEYRSSAMTFSCVTDDLDEGLYVVQVVDAAQPGEGTARAQVAVTAVKGYDPNITLADTELDATAGDPATLRLTGWQPGVPVKVRVVHQDGETVFTGRAVPGADGSATVVTPKLTEGHHEINVSDGLWQLDGAEGAYNGAYSGFHAS